MTDRHDPMVAAGAIITAVRDVAAAVPDARATVGRLQPVPGGTNVIASAVHVWLDARHPSDAVTADVVRTIHERARDIAAAEGCAVELVEESLSPTAHFDAALRDRLSTVLPDAPLLATGAGHDAGVLGGHLPTGMLFVGEHVEDADAEAGADALADALRDLLRDPA
jgi:N-carbamoyl-L-amino-acid hydrolase